VLQPLYDYARHGLRVTEVVDEGPGVVSFRFTGRNLDRLQVRAGQFFLWRFLARGHWWEAHPFSLSEAPDGRSLRITIKASGDYTGKLLGLKAGTRVLTEGPFGVFTDAARRRDKSLLIAGGIGITPIRALLEELGGQTALIYRVLADDDVVFRSELDELARRRGFTPHYVVGDHAAPEGTRILDADHLRELVPDVAERDVFVCGPPAMTNAIVKTVRSVGVPRRLIHAERFAY
jgi:ferredoxin-NADP reductase